MTAGRELEAARRLADRGAASAGLSRLVGGETALVLLIDLAAGTVTYANDRARQLAPNAKLPVSVADWSEAAGLQVPDGQELEASANPLARIAAGEPVTGEEVTAARASDSTAQREPLWVIGLPLEGAPGPLGEQALIVFLPLRAQGEIDIIRNAGAEALQSRAISATGLSFTISDPHLDDNPLVWVNPAFLLETGYTEDEVIGRNCRFLQGPDTDPESIRRLRAAVHSEQPISEVILNYRKDGTTFWNELTISPVYDGEGRLTNLVGVQADVTMRVLAERASAEARELAGRALEAEREARMIAEAAQAEAHEAMRSAERAVQEAERSQRILGLLAEATTVLAGTLDVQEALSRLAGLLVPLLGDWVFINLIDEGGHLRRATIKHRDGRDALLERLADLQYRGLAPDAPVRRAIENRRPLLMSELDLEQASTWMTPEMVELTGQLGLGSALYVPLIARRRVLGAIALFSSERGRFDEPQLEVVQEIARRAALMVDNARLYDQEHQAALTLQRSMLSSVPEVPGLDITALYVPGSAGAEIGGDWYDVMPLPDGSTALAVGDVMGHDIAAAAAMGQLRSVLRAYAFEGGGPARVVQRVDQLVQGLGVVPLATCCYATLSPQRVLTWTNAGHLPPLLRRPDGTVEELRMPDPDIVVGVAPPELPRAEMSIDLPVGSVVVLFTDGLVEGRTREISAGVADVARLLAEHDPAMGSAALAARLNDYADGPDREDDICLLVVHVRGN